MAPGQRLDQITHMSTNTTEAALEACIERHLTGGVSGAVSDDGNFKEDPSNYPSRKDAGYVRGKAADFNTEFAIDEHKFWQFRESTQATELAKLQGGLEAAGARTSAPQAEGGWHSRRAEEGAGSLQSFCR
jgi:hypothetical protein